jgi:hypothetical protein
LFKQAKKILLCQLTKNLSIFYPKTWYGTKLSEKRVGDPGKTYPGSRGKKKHRIPEPDPQHSGPAFLFYTLFIIRGYSNIFTFSSREFFSHATLILCHGEAKNYVQISIATHVNLCGF